jgi:hypothetical protein
MRRITIMSGPIRFRILAIVIGIKKSRICLFRKKVVQRSIHHTELAKLYSQKVISRMVCLADLRGGKFDPPGLSRQREWNRNGPAPVVLNEWKDV